MIEETIKIISDVVGAIAGFDKLEAAGKRIGNSLQGVGSKLQGVGGRLTDLGKSSAAFTAPLAVGLGYATHKAVEFQDAMGGASRALDLSTSEVEKFGSEIKKIAPSLGQTPAKFADLATEAGKLGVAKNDILAFTKNVAEIAAITDITEQQTTDLAGSFAALQTITGSTTEQLKYYGAAVNKLDDSIGGTTPDIIEFTRQTAATGKLLKLGIKDLAAYGSTMQSLGIQNGVAYRSFNALLTKLASPQTLSAQGQQALKDLGISAQEMSRIMTQDANKGIELFLGQINKVSKVDVSKALGAVKQVIGGDYADEILTLAGSTDKLHQALAAVGNDQGNLSKYASELDKKLGSIKGQQAILAAQSERLAIAIGSALLPAITSLLGNITPLVEKFSEFAEANPAIVKVGVAIAGIAAIATPVLFILGSLISTIGTITAAFSAAAPIIAGVGVVIAGISAPIWGTIAIFAALGIALGTLIANWRLVAAAIPQLPNAIATAVNIVRANLSGMVANWQYATASISAHLSGFSKWVFNAGVRLVENFAQGIYNTVTAPVRAIAWVVSQVRQYLPSSPAKIGPLSDLDKTGSGMIRTIAQTITPTPITDALNSALGSVVGGVGSTPQLSSPAIASATNSNSFVVNDNRTITIANGSGKNDLIEALRKSDRELLDLIDKAVARWNRGN